MMRRRATKPGVLSCLLPPDALRFYDLRLTATACAERMGGGTASLNDYLTNFGQRVCTMSRKKILPAADALDRKAHANAGGLMSGTPVGRRTQSSRRAGRGYRGATDGAAFRSAQCLQEWK